MLALQLDLNDSTFSSLCYLSLLRLLFYSLSCPELTFTRNQGAKQRPHVCIDYLWLESDRSLALFDYLALLTSDQFCFMAPTLFTEDQESTLFVPSTRVCLYRIKQSPLCKSKVQSTHHSA